MNEPAVELFSLKRFVKSTTSVDELPKEVTPKLGKSSTKNESSVLFPPKIHLYFYYATYNTSLS